MQIVETRRKAMPATNGNNLNLGGPARTDIQGNITEETNNPG